jgi:hypothetical protein
MWRQVSSNQHEITTELDPQRGGWIASCSCGWEAKMPHWYKVDAKRDGTEHLNGIVTKRTEPAP